MRSKNHATSQSRKGLAAFAARQVHAPLAHAWQCLVDVDSYPSMCSTCTAVERLDRHDAIKVGSQWRETRHYGRRLYKIVVTATAVLEEPSESALVVTTTVMGATSTSTQTVQAIDDHTCMVTLSYAMVANHVWSKMWTMLFGWQIRRQASDALETELNDLAKAVEDAYESELQTDNGE